MKWHQRQVHTSASWSTIPTRTSRGRRPDAWRARWTMRMASRSNRSRARGTRASVCMTSPSTRMPTIWRRQMSGFFGRRYSFINIRLETTITTEFYRTHCRKELKKGSTSAILQLRWMRRKMASHQLIRGIERINDWWRRPSGMRQILKNRFNFNWLINRLIKL